MIEGRSALLTALTVALIASLVSQSNAVRLHVVPSQTVPSVAGTAISTPITVLLAGDHGRPWSAARHFRRAGYSCSIQSEAGMYLVSGQSTSTVQDTCTFAEVVLSPDTPAGRLRLHVCLRNASATVACNATSIVVTRCATAETPANVTNALQTLLTSTTSMQPFVVQGTFEWRDRFAVDCVLRATTGSDPFRVRAQWVDVCAVACDFTLSASVLVNRSAFGYLNVAIRGREASGSCSQSSAFRPGTALYAQRASRCGLSSPRDGVAPGCPVAVVGPGVSVSYDASNLISTPVRDSSILRVAQDQLRVAQCDASSNAVPHLLPGYTVSPASTSFTNFSFDFDAERLETVLNNVTLRLNSLAVITSSGSASYCDPGATPLLLPPAPLMGWQQTDASTIVITSPTVPCVALSLGVAQSVVFANPSMMRRRADTLEDYAVVLSGIDAVGRAIQGQMPAVVTVVVEIAARSSAGVLVRSPAPVTFEVTTSTFPQRVLVQFPTPATNVTLVAFLKLPVAQPIPDELSGTIVVQYCSPTLRTTHGIVGASVSFEADVCGVKSNITRPLISVTAANSVVTVGGARFDYGTPVFCHFSNYTDPWSPSVEGSVGLVVSSCEVLCPVGPQLYPIRQGSGLTAIPNPGGGRALSVVDISSLAGPIGHLRIRQSGAPWSNALAIDVVGHGYTTSVSAWSSNTFPRRAITYIDPITVEVVDILGTTLSGFDPLRRQVVLTSPPRALQILNASGAVSSSSATCQPAPGVAKFPTLELFDPQQGDYGLYLVGEGLVTSSTILHIRTSAVNYAHRIELSNVVQDYVNVSLESFTDGLFPVQPQVIIVRQDSTAADSDVSDVTCIATVTPLDAAEPSDPSRGLGLTTSVPGFGNSAKFALGIATFVNLRYVGLPGKQYKVTIALDNATANVLPKEFTVYTPYCPLKQFGATVPIGQVSSTPNSSLTAEVVTVKGWTFPATRSGTASQSYTCTAGGAVLPATFVDMCTIECFRPNAAVAAGIVSGITTCANRTAAVSCCYDVPRGVVRCDKPIDTAIVVAVPNSASAGSQWLVSVGNFTFIGLPESLRVIPNVQSPWTVFGNQQLIRSAENVTLNPIIIGLFDSEGNFVGRTDDGHPRPVRVTSVLRRAVPVLSVPSNSTALQQRLLGPFLPAGAPSSCFQIVPPTVSLTGPRLLWISNGTVVFDQLTMRWPAAGAYDILFETFPPQPFDPSLSASSFDGRAADFNATATAHVVSGVPAAPCLYTDMSGVALTNSPLDRQPVLMLLDGGGNLVQPFVFGAVLDVERDSADLSIEVSLWAQPYDYRAGRGVGAYEPVSENLARDDAVAAPAAQVSVSGAVSVIEFAFKQLAPVRIVFGMQYVLRFHIAGFSNATDATTPPLLRRQCEPNQYGVVSEDTCLPCPSGVSHCLGGSNLGCFICNGSTGLNVTDGYWRDSPKSVVAYACDTGGVCLGNTETGTCGERYLNHRPLCAVCESGSARDILGTCVECAPTWVSVLVLAIFVLAAVVVLAILIMATLKEDGNADDGNNSLVGLLKIFVNFVQVTGMLGEFQVNFPSYVLSYFDIVAASSGGAGISISPVNCLFPNLTYLDKLVVQLVLPPILLIFLATTLLVSGWRKRRRAQMMGTWVATGPKAQKLFNWPLFVTAAVVLLFIIYQTILTQCIDAFACISLQTGVPGEQDILILKRDARVDCREITYQRHVAVALYGLFVYGLVLPLTGMILVLRTARTESWFAANGTFSFLIRGFRLRFWFWEFVIVFRKVLIRVLLSAVQDATLQALLGIWTLTGLFILHAFTRPYVKAQHNRAEGLGLLTLVVTLNIGLLFRSAQLVSSNSSSCDTVTCSLVVVVLIAFNLGVIGYFVYAIGFALFEHVVELFGVDGADGSRGVSRRNVKRILLQRIGQAKRHAPNFKTYTPKFINRDLAVTLLGADVVEDLEFADPSGVAGADDDFTLAGGAEDDEVEESATQHASSARRRRRGQSRARTAITDAEGGGGGSESDSDEIEMEAVNDLSLAELEAEAVAEDEALLESIFDPIDVPPPPPEISDDAATRGGIAEAPTTTRVLPPKRRFAFTDFPNVAVTVAEEAADTARAAARAAGALAVDAAGKAIAVATSAGDAALDTAVAARLAAAKAARELAFEASDVATDALDTVRDVSFHIARSMSETVHIGGASATRRTLRDSFHSALTYPTGERNAGGGEDTAPVGATAAASPFPVPMVVVSDETLNEAVDAAEDMLAARQRRERRSTAGGQVRGRSGSRRGSFAAAHDAANEDTTDMAERFLKSLNAAGLPT